MRRGLSIRARLALVYALLAVLMLAAVTVSVWLIEQRDSRLTLERNARASAADLAVAVSAPSTDGDGDVDDGGTGGDETDEALPSAAATGSSVLERYLAERAGAAELLAVLQPDGARLANRRDALALLDLRTSQPTGVEHVTLAGSATTIARQVAASGAIVVAAVPAQVEGERLERLLAVLVAVGLAALFGTVLLAWLAARRALDPLRRIAVRAARVSGGDLGLRVGGDVRTRDEVGLVARAIDDMLDRLESAFRAQRRFVQDASHELRTPLTIARGHLEVLALDADPDPADVREAIALAVGEIDRMGELVAALLRLARLDERGLERDDPVDLVELAGRAAERVRGLGERSIEVVAEGDCIVSGDPGLLEQVLLNLLSNAVRHTRPGGAIAIEARRRGGEVLLAVTDDGDGIDPALLPTLFDRFTRADSARRRDRGGAGLGLAICRAIVDAHGGVISGANAPTGGAVLSVLLPAR